MLVLTGIVFLVELICGFVTNSLALQSDAFHMLSDEASLVIGLVAVNLATRPPSDTMSFGWARTEVIGALCNATFLLAICLTLFCDAIERFFSPQTIEEPILFIVVGAVGLLTNLIGMFIFHDHGHSDNLKGVFLHVLGDFFGSIGVLISACVINFTDWEYKYYVDPVISLIIVIILVYGTVPLFKRTAKIVLEAVPQQTNMGQVREELLKISHLVAVHELHIWELSKQSFIAMIHIVVDSKDFNKEVLEAVHNLMISFGVYSTTVQIEFVDDFPSEVDHNASCFYASSFGKDKRVFITPPVYRHSIGCPHLNIPGEESHDHDHDHHDHHHDHDHDHHDHSHSGKKNKKKQKHIHDHDQHLNPDENVPDSL